MCQAGMLGKDLIVRHAPTATMAATAATGISGTDPPAPLALRAR